MTKQRPCPYCNHQFSYKDERPYETPVGTYYVCPGCHKNLVRSIQIYPSKDWRWGKPYNNVQLTEKAQL